MADGLNATTKYIATHRPESLAWGPFEGLGPDLVEGISPHQVAGRPGPYPLGQLHADIDAARTWPCGGSPADRLSGPVGHREAHLCGGNPATLIRTRQHQSNAVRHYPQSLQGGRTFEDSIDAEFPLLIPSVSALAISEE